jgi:predicted acyltransferase
MEASEPAIHSPTRENSRKHPAGQISRYVSIDAFRAVTLLLMIFVNDFGTLRGIPDWLKHTEAAEDGMGFSDVIFPAFLFIVGLSIPVAMDIRLKNNGSVAAATGHIILRSLALLIMGFFHVNLGNYSQEAILSRPVYQILVTISFFLIWMDYRREGSRRLESVLKWSGVVMLLVLAVQYKGNSVRGTVWMEPKWWGILGLIGWSYLLCSLFFLWSSGRMWKQVSAFLFFMLFNAAYHLEWLSGLVPVRDVIWIVGDGSMPAMVMAGAITTIIYKGDQTRKFFYFAGITALLLISYGLLTRPIWEISKIRATPSWTAICTGISMLCFAILAYSADLKRRVQWYQWIRPAGISTLTCFLLPYIHDAILQMTDLRLPVILRTGLIGLVKSMMFSLLIVSLAGWLNRYRIRLKL